MGLASVDDEAAAGLVSCFCSPLAKPIGQGDTPANAMSLLQAKRWVRHQPKWSAPRYWDTLIQVGPS